MVTESSLKFELLGSLNMFSKFEFCERSKTVELGQNGVLKPQRTDLSSITGLVGASAPVVTAQNVVLLTKHSNIATFVENLTGSSRFDKLWIQGHTVLAIQKVKWIEFIGLDTGQFPHPCRSLGIAVDEAFLL